MNTPVGRTVILTGASKGIGWEIAQCLLSEPLLSNVVVVARTKEPLLKLKEKYGRRVEILCGDATDPELPDEAVKAALKSYGRIDGLIVNHGILGPVTKVNVADVDAWRKGFEVNFFSAVEFVKSALPHIRISRGNIIFTSSGAAVGPVNGWGLYGATKAALNHFNMTLGKEEPEIVSLAIRPGMVDTGMQEELRSQHTGVLGAQDAARFINAHKEGKLLPPEKPGQIIARLATGAPRWLSGRFLTWDCEELKEYQTDEWMKRF